MDRTWASGRITVVQGDITRLDVDAIVNAANARSSGRRRGWRDPRAAGPGLLESAARSAARAPARRSSPAATAFRRGTSSTRWARSGRAAPPARSALARCYREAMRLAAGHALRSIAFRPSPRALTGFRSSGRRASPSRRWRPRWARPSPGARDLLLLLGGDRDVYVRVLDAAGI
jgi:hypothetical protein